MSRVRLIEIKQRDFLAKVQGQAGFSVRELADICKTHRRSFSDWKHDRYLMPLSVFEKLLKIGNFKSPKTEILEEYWYAKKAGRAGGLAVYKKYGKVPGWTPEASRRGGLKAAETLRRKGINLFSAKPVFLPKHSPQLAEFVGILLGDGGLTKSQVAISLNRVNDREFVFYVEKLFQQLFGVTPSFYDREEESTLNIVASRVKLVRFFVEMGLCIGSKVRQQVAVPSWIEKSGKFIKPCLRGLFDTDGCFYIDKHRYKNKTYYNCGMNFTNRSLPILFFFKNKLKEFGFHPTHNTKFSIFLRRESEIKEYFQEIGSSNPKHINKLREYFQKKHGEVPKLVIPARFRKPMVI